MILDRQSLEDCDTGGIGGTLAANALSLAAMRATLTKVLTKEAFDRMISMAERWTAGVQKIIQDSDLPWHASVAAPSICSAPVNPKTEPKLTTPWTSSLSDSCISTP